MIGEEAKYFIHSLNLEIPSMEEYLNHVPGYKIVRYKDLKKLKPGSVYIKHAPINEVGVEMGKHIRKGGVLVAIGNMENGKFKSVPIGSDYKYMMLKFSPSFNGEITQKNLERYMRRQLKNENCFYYIKCQEHHIFSKNLKFSNDNFREMMLKLINRYHE